MFSIEPFSYLTLQMERELANMKLSQADILKALALTDTFFKKELDFDHQYVGQMNRNGASIEETDIGSKSVFERVFQEGFKSQAANPSYQQSSEFEVVQKEYRKKRQQSDGIRQLIKRNRENMLKNKDKIQKYRLQKQQLEAEKKSLNDRQKIGTINPKFIMGAPKKQQQHTMLKVMRARVQDPCQQTIRN